MFDPGDFESDGDQPDESELLSQLFDGLPSIITQPSADVEHGAFHL